MATASPLPEVSTPAPAVQATPVKTPAKTPVKTPVKAAPTKVADKKSPKPKKSKTQVRRATKPKAVGVGSHPPYGDMYASIISWLILDSWGYTETETPFQTDH